MALYCRCGELCEVASTPGDAALSVAAGWEKRHPVGAVHGPVTKRTAAAVRRQLELAERVAWERRVS